MTGLIFPTKPKIIKETDTEGVFEIENLYTGYGLTLGNALRRVLLSSLKGFAITSVKIKGVSHEFSVIDGVLEDVIQIILNLKKIRVKTYTPGPHTLTLSVKGEKKVKASDIQKNSNIEIVTPDIHIATLTDKKSELEMVLTVEEGIGYSPAETRQKEKLPVGTISLDVVFSPVRKVNYEVENMRVGERTDYNRLRLYIETDGTMAPSIALKQAAEILQEHFKIVADLPIPEQKETEKTEEEKKISKKTTKAKEEKTKKGKK